MPSSDPWLISGLGNPGRTYAMTRHNVGFMALDRVVGRLGMHIDQKKFNTCYGRGSHAGNRLVAAKPMAFMNRSGQPLRQLAGYYNIPPCRMIVIHDDIDIGQGRIKIKEKGGHGGHNGIKSIMEAFGTGDFPRLRIGIGRPEAPMDVSDYVLARFTETERRFFEDLLEIAVDAVITMIELGLAQGMNIFNQKQVG